MKDYLTLFWLFFKLGIVNFGGGYALLPLLQREFCEKRDWLKDDEIADYYAIGQCTPGAIAVNVSTFVGYKRKGVIGGIVATLGFITPALIIIAIIASILTNFADVKEVQSAFKAVRVVVFVLVLQAILKLSKNSITDIYQLIICLLVLFLSIFTSIPLFVYVIVAGVAGIILGLYKEKKKRPKLKPIDNDEKDLESLALDETIEKEEANEAIEIKEETKVKDTNDSIGKKLLFFFIGFLSGLSLGLLGIPLLFIVKNKKFKEGFYTTVLVWVVLLVLILVSAFSGNWIFVRLFFEFFRVGICAFGGGLATIPFLKELSEATGWYTIDELANMIAVSESTPGAMGINMSTYVGYEVISGEFNNMFLGYVGGITSTLGLITPSIMVIIVVAQILSVFRHAKGVEWAFYGLRAASIGLIGNAAYSILTLSIVSPSNAATAFNSHGVNGSNFFTEIWGAVSDAIINFFDYKCLALALAMGIVIFKFKKHPIIYIAAAAVIGIIFQF